MPTTKAHHRNSGIGLNRRNLSSGSSKAGLNLHFTSATQKEVGKAGVGEKAKKGGVPHETNGRNTSPHPRFHRTQSREHVTQVYQQRQKSALNPNSAKASTKPKKGFTIAQDDDDDDDDDEGEWVSSESGAATPLKEDSDTEGEDGTEGGSKEEEGTTPVENKLGGLREKLKSMEQMQQMQQARADTRVGRAGNPKFQPLQDTTKDQTREEVKTPTFSTQPQTQQHHQAQHQQLRFQQLQDNDQVKSPQKQQTAPPNLPQVRYERPTPPPLSNHQRYDSEPTAPSAEVRPGTHSDLSANPPHRAHPNNANSKRFSSSHSRPTSMHSPVGVSALRPHPLIRGMSYGQSGPPLAPLTVINDGAPAQVSSSPPQIAQLPGAKKSPLSSPHLADVSAGGSTSASNTPTQFPRRTSVSSAKSVAFPLHHSTHKDQLPVGPGLKSDRTRTLSTLSTSSSFTALASLAQFPTKGEAPASSRPGTPQMVAYFPAQGKGQANLEAIHPQLPAPYVGTHLTILGYRTPLRESYDRVMRAKQVR